VLRGFARDAEAAHATLSALAREAKGLPGAAEAADLIGKMFTDGASEANARVATERLAHLAAAAALQASAPGEVADSFARARLSGRRGATYGTSELGVAAMATFLARVLPAP
jgi:putative acyl-CoA dehydrogenase